MPTAPTGVPPQVIETLRGSPSLGQLDQSLLLVTVDTDGVPDVCMLSRAEVEATPDEVRAVVASHKARANLVGGDRATLVIVAGGIPHYLALRRQRMAVGDGAVAYAFSVTRIVQDDFDIELHPMLFRVEKWLVDTERWDRSQTLLRALDEPS